MDSKVTRRQEVHKTYEMRVRVNLDDTLPKLEFDSDWVTKSTILLSAIDHPSPQIY